MTTPNPILPVSPELSIPASILVVDDEEAVRNVLARGLWAAGFQCMTAADGTQALARLRQGRFAVMLLDIRMPGMDGLAVLAEAQRLDPDMPVIMVTALAGLDVALGAIRSGAYDYVTAQVTIIPAAGHLPHLEQPERTAETVLRFLAAQDVGGERRPATGVPAGRG